MKETIWSKSEARGSGHDIVELYDEVEDAYCEMLRFGREHCEDEFGGMQQAMIICNFEL